jgi:protocatechuate 3,4-dioxygenase beta subunit
VNQAGRRYILGVATAKIAVLGFATLAICRGASLQGQVTATTGEPVKNATVRLQHVAASPPQGQAASPANVFNTTTDAAGNFVFESIDPGRYIVSVQQHPGYLRQAQAQTIIISANQPASIAIKLTPESRIEGRVTNQDGKPFVGARVSAWRWSTAGPYLQLTAPGTNDVTVAEDGSFVIGGLSAGHYFVSVSPTLNPLAQEQKSPRETDIATYFPGVAAVSSATLLKVARGAILQGIDIRVLRGVVYSVQGRAVDAATGSTIANAFITLFADGPGRQAAASATTVDGAFQLTVGPGDYMFQARLLPARSSNVGDVFTPSLFTDQRVTVGKENIEDLVLHLSRGAVIEGRFSTEDSGRQLPQPGRPANILLDSNGPNEVYQSQIQTNGDGSFVIYDVGPGQYAAHAVNLPAGTYVKSLRYGQQDVANKNIDVALGVGGTLEILLSPHAADVTGIIRTSNGDPMPGVQVTVWRPGQAVDGTAITGSNGSFQIGNLAPGEYRAIALQGPGLLVPAFLSQFESQAATVKLDQDSHQKIEVPLIKQDAIDAALENLR